jgi:hypothetical protein
MTTDDFRRIVLSLPGAEELNGLGYSNFCVGLKRFVTIEGPDSTPVIRLTRDQQATFVAAAPGAFAPLSSGWGRLGSTVIQLEVADEATVQDAVATAWRNVANVAAEGVAVGANARKLVTDVASPANGASAVHVADVVSVEPFDRLRNVIERLQSFWESGPVAGK